MDAHSKYMAEAVEGKGCDRHLFGRDYSEFLTKTKLTLYKYQINRIKLYL